MDMFETKGYVAMGELTPDSILSRVSELTIFHYYISSFKQVGKAFCSEIRKDASPSCTIFIVNSGKAIYKDFATGDSLNCFQYIMTRFGCNFNTCLRKIANDLLSAPNLLDKLESLPIQHVIKERQQTPMGIVSMPFSSEALEYWNQYGITPEILEAYDVKQISYFKVRQFGTHISKAEKYAFAYCFGNYRYKIVRPNVKSLQRKWLTNCPFTVVQGLPMLPVKGDLLFITKALKDVMTFYSMGINAIAPQSENSFLPKRIVELIKERYTTSLIYYDNDGPGKEAAKKHSKFYEVDYIHNPSGDPKDPSDFYKEKGEEAFRITLNQLLQNVKNNFHSGKCSITEEQQNKDSKGDIPF